MERERERDIVLTLPRAWMNKMIVIMWRVAYDKSIIIIIININNNVIINCMIMCVIVITVIIVVNVIIVIMCLLLCLLLALVINYASLRVVGSPFVDPHAKSSTTSISIIIHIYIYMYSIRILYMPRLFYCSI